MEGWSLVTVATAQPSPSAREPTSLRTPSESGEQKSGEERELILYLSPSKHSAWPYRSRAFSSRGKAWEKEPDSRSKGWE